MAGSAVAALDQGWASVFAAAFGALGLIVVALVGRANHKVGKRAEAAASEAVAQLTPNGGSSAFDKLGARLDAQDHKLDVILGAVAKEAVHRELADGMLAGRIDRLEGKQ